jgi:hypothetical protein
MAQLCAIAKQQIEADPALDNLEWSERIKDRLLRLEFTYPEDPSAIHRAMSQVEHALRKEWGPRPAPTLVTPATRTDDLLPQADPALPRPQSSEQFTSLKALIQTLRLRGSSR